MMAESFWQRERKISVQALIAAILVAGELETERQGRTRPDGGEETERREKRGIGSTARRCSKAEVYLVLPTARIHPYSALPTAKGPGHRKAIQKACCGSLWAEKHYRKVECDPFGSTNHHLNLPSNDRLV
jgi:hypothetical protein